MQLKTWFLKGNCQANIIVSTTSPTDKKGIVLRKHSDYLVCFMLSIIFLSLGCIKLHGRIAARDFYQADVSLGWTRIPAITLTQRPEMLTCVPTWTSEHSLLMICRSLLQSPYLVLGSNPRKACLTLKLSMCISLCRAGALAGSCLSSIFCATCT